MICYKDMTFCGYYTGCAVKDCPRAYTAEVTLKSIYSGLPVCCFVEKPDCFVKADKEV